MGSFASIFIRLGISPPLRNECRSLCKYLLQNKCSQIFPGGISTNVLVAKV